jgi:DNA-directed RNA polymerase subunit RPC12/RpoP
MKCFIHDKTDAQGVCLKCGRAMCKNCMKFAKYSSICPKCRMKLLVKRTILNIFFILIFGSIIYFFMETNFIMQLENLLARVGIYLHYLEVLIYIFGGLIIINIIVIVFAAANIIIIKDSEKRANATLAPQKPKE